MGLARKRILVTRPSALAGPLAERIAAAGGTPVRYPAIEIAAPADAGAARNRLARLADYDLVIFISPTAVTRAGELRATPWPLDLRAFAVGDGTRRALDAAGVHEALAPADGADSEALLAMPELMDVDGKRALIVRGEGGRALLGRELEARGASVEYAECYRRVPPSASPPEGAFDAICANSSEALENLVARLGVARLRAAALFVPHERVARAATALGLPAPVVAGPGDDALVARLVAYFDGAK